MHELPITQNLLELALKHADEAGGGTITGLYLQVGKLSSVVDESVQFYWNFISEDTPAEGAKLHFNHIPLTMECLDCNISFEPDEYSYTCTACSGFRVRITGGDEFCLEAIDLEPVQVSESESGS